MRPHTLHQVPRQKEIGETIGVQPAADAAC